MMLIVGSDSSLGKAVVGAARTKNISVNVIRRIAIQKGKKEIEHCLGFLDKTPDVVINIWGINHLSWIGNTPEEDQNILLENVMTPYWIINGLVNLGHGPCRVLNIASQTYRVPQRCTALYAASKAALVMLTKVMARELAPKGWVINALAPGKIQDTKMSEMTDAQVSELRSWKRGDADRYALDLIPMCRFTDRYEVTKAIFQILELPSYINGTCIDMTGGV